MQKTQQPKNREVGSYNYSIQDVLGKGFSSVVYKGYNSLTKQLVAIKAIENDIKKNQIHKKMIKTEIRVLNILKNTPHIINLFDLQETEQHTYIITEYCEKGTLKRFMQKKKGFSEQQAMHIFQQIFLGYETIYKAGIIHRDIKPANILVLKNDQIKIADFGFAIPINELSSEESLIIGSPMYMPYQALKKRVYTYKGDIWALGITLYQMLNGVSPFKAKTEKELIRQINYGSIQKMIPTRFSEKVQTLLARMLEFDKDARASIDQIRQILYGPKIVSNVFNTMKNLNRQKTRENNSKQKSKSKSQSTKEEFPPKCQKPYRASEKCESNNVLQKKSEERQTSIEKTKLRNRTMTLKADRTEIMSDKKIVENSLDNCKHISHQLICQIHFCRFAYKLLTRMLKGNCNVTHQLKCQMSGLIFKKLEQTQKLTLVEPSIVNEYKNSKYYKEIENIVNEYRSRYTTEIKKIVKFWHSFEYFRKSMETQIIRIYEQVKDLSDPSTHSDLVIILDYMITLKQLCRLLQKQDLGQFHKNSKIEKIVEGVPSKNITVEHVKAIKNKLKGIQLI